MKDKISVIVPVYNVEQYLDKCVQSIVTQTYKNLEIILVDDGSTDNSGAICDEWAKKDSRIVVIHKENGGLSDARNAGVLAASGEYIGFIDSDDYIEPVMYEKLYSLISVNDADMALCGVQRKNENGETFSPFSTRQIGKFQGEEIFNTVDFNNPYYIIAWNKLYKRNLVLKIQFPKGRLHEDEFTAHRFYGECKKIVCCDTPLYHYLKRMGSIMRNGYSVKNLDAVYAFLDRYYYFKEIGRKKELKKCANFAYGKALHIISNIDVSQNSAEVKKCLKAVLPVIMRYNPLKAAKLYLTYIKRR